MAVTITTAQLAVALRLASDPDSVPPEVATVVDLVRLGAVALIERFTSQAPDDVANVACIQLAGFLYEVEPGTPLNSVPFINSGACALLSPWRTFHAGALPDADGSGVVPSGSDLPPFPTDGRNYILNLEDGVLTWVAFPKP